MKIRAPVVLLAAGFVLLGVALSCKQPSGPPPDTASPTVSVSSSTSDPTGEPLIALLIVFSEVVSGFEVTDLTLMNATSSNFATADNETFTVDLTPLAEGLVTLNIAASVCTDAAGNPNAVLTSAFSRTYTQKPFAIISSATTAATNTSPIPITITFNKAVDNFEQADVTGTNCAISNFINAVANYEWTADLTPAGQGTVQAAVPAGVCFQQGNARPKRRLGRVLEDIRHHRSGRLLELLGAGQPARTRASRSPSLLASPSPAVRSPWRHHGERRGQRGEPADFE